jgi:hypothetical protein
MLKLAAASFSVSAKTAGRRVRRYREQGAAGLPLPRFRSGLPHAGPEASLHPPLHTAHQRQGGALHPNPAPRMGLCPHLSELERTQLGAPPLGCTHRYNWHQPHGSLGASPSSSRSALDRNNLLRLHNAVSSEGRAFNWLLSLVVPSVISAGNNAEVSRAEQNQAIEAE